MYQIIKEEKLTGEKNAGVVFKIVVKGLECQHVEKGKCVRCAFGLNFYKLMES